MDTEVGRQAAQRVLESLGGLGDKNTLDTIRSWYSAFPRIIDAMCGPSPLRTHPDVRLRMAVVESRRKSRPGTQRVLERLSPRVTREEFFGNPSVSRNFPGRRFPGIADAVLAIRSTETGAARAFPKQTEAQREGRGDPTAIVTARATEMLWMHENDDLESEAGFLIIDKAAANERVDFNVSGGKLVKLVEPLNLNVKLASSPFRDAYKEFREDPENMVPLAHPKVYQSLDAGPERWTTDIVDSGDFRPLVWVFRKSFGSRDRMDEYIASLLCEDPGFRALLKWAFTDHLKYQWEIENIVARSLVEAHWREMFELIGPGKWYCLSNARAARLIDREGYGSNRRLSARRRGGKPKGAGSDNIHFTLDRDMTPRADIKPILINNPAKLDAMIRRGEI